jgi:hypothetical protein
VPGQARQEPAPSALHQQLDPFRFIVYAELAGLEIGLVR